MEDPPPSYSSYDNYQTPSEFAAPTNQQLRNPIGHRRDVDGQVRHGDRHRRDADGQGRYGDRHRRDIDGEVRHGNRRDADGQGRHGDRHRRDIDGRVRHGDRRDVDGQGRHGDRRDADGQGRHGDRYRRDGDRHRRDGDGHRQDVDGHRQDGDGYRQDVDGYRQDVDGYRQDVDGHRQDVDGYGQDVDGYRQDVDGHRQDVDGYGQDVDGYRQDVDGHRQDVDGYRQGVDGYRQDVDGYRQDVDGYRQDVDGYRQGVDGYRQDVDGYRQDVDGHRQDVDGYRQDVDGYRQGVDGYRQDVDGYRQDVDGHRQDVDGYRQGVDGYRQDVDGYRQDAVIHFEVDNENLIEGLQNASNTFSGFIDIMHDKKKLPWGFAQNTIYKLGLCTYFFVNLIYSIVATSVQRDQLPYHLLYVCISFIGFVIEFGVIIIVTTRKCCTDDGDDINDGEFHRADQQVQAYYRHARNVLVDYVISSIGEFLIYPTLICVLYGFINERSWQFDNGIHICNLIVLAYSVIMNALYMKFYMIFLMIKVLRASYIKYDELAQPTKVEWKRYFTPVYLSIPLAFTTAITHWSMTGIIGVRIYVDNFTPQNDDTNSSIPNTGDYRVAPLTGYMIGCTIFLPILSWMTYIILNKLWFYEVYSAISQLKSADHMHLQDKWDENRYVWDKKLIDFITNPLAYIAIVFLMISFIAYTVGTYPLDYDSSEYKVASSARESIHILGFCFIGLFLLSNLQAAIIFTIIVLVIVVLILSGVILLLCGLPILCVVLCYNQCCK